MEYIKVFRNHSDYEDFVESGEMLRPNVSHCVEENEVHYNPHTFADEYFTTVARENGTISFNIQESMGTDMITSISYSTDNGETWITTNNVNSQVVTITTPTVNTGDKVLWKGDAQQLGYIVENYGDYVGSFFSSDCEFDAQGNVMSLLYGDNFKDKTTIETKGCFYFLFSSFDGESQESYSKLVDASKLVLPAITLANYCYSSMFYGCTSLTVAPELPATTLESSCYSEMFADCTSLTTAPELPATTLAERCYRDMFNGCSNLNYIKAMFTTTPSDTYTSNWVYRVASTGTFVKNSAATWNVTGVHGIPTGWTVQKATA